MQTLTNGFDISKKTPQTANEGLTSNDGLAVLCLIES